MPEHPEHLDSELNNYKLEKDAFIAVSDRKVDYTLVDSIMDACFGTMVGCSMTYAAFSDFDIRSPVSFGETIVASLGIGAAWGIYRYYSNRNSTNDGGVSQ